MLLIFVRSFVALATLFASTFFASLAVAGTNSWTTLGPTGGYFRGLAAHPTLPGVVYSAVGDTVYRSADGGATWAAQPKHFSNIIHKLLVDPTNGNVIYVFVGNVGLWRSSDQGDNFSLVSSAPATTGVTASAISSDGAQIVVGTASGDIYVSADRGATWSQRSPIVTSPFLGYTYATAIAIDPTNRNVLVAGMINAGLYRSMDGGMTWTEVFHWQQQNYITGLAFDPANHNHLLFASGTIWESSNGGASWNSMSGVTGFQVAFDPTDSQRIYTADSNAVWRTSNGGASWTIANISDGIYFGQPQILAVDPFNRLHIWSAGDATISASDDGGMSWHDSDLGIYGVGVIDLHASPTSTQGLILAANRGFPRKFSTGTTWTRLAENHIYLDSNAVSYGSSSDQVILAAPALGGVVRSTDDGASWQGQSSGSMTFYSLVPHPSLASTFWGATSSGVATSFDGGNNWQIRNTPSDFSGFGAIAIDPNNPSIIYAGSSSYGSVYKGIAKSTNGGSSWTSVSNGIGTAWIKRIAVDPVDGNMVYAVGGVGSTGIVRSTDGGQQWTAITVAPAGGLPVGDIAIDPHNRDILYVASGSLFRSVDRGNTWETLFAQPSYSGIRVLALDSQTPSIIYAGLNEGSVRSFEIAPNVSISATTSSPSQTEGASSRVALTLQNSGPFSATIIAVGGTWSRTVTSPIVSAAGGSCTAGTTSYRCTFASLAPGESATINVDFVAPVGSTTLTAVAAAYERDPDISNNTAQISVTTVPAADLSINVGSNPADLGVNQSLTLTARLTNSGPSAAAASHIVIDLGANLRYVSSSTDAGSCSSTGIQVQCDVGNVAVGANVTVTVSATAQTAGTTTVSALASASTADSISTNNQSSFAITVRAASSSGGGGGGGSVDAISLLALLSLLFMARDQRYTRPISASLTAATGHPSARS